MKHRTLQTRGIAGSLGLLLSYAASALIIIDPSEEPNVDAYCPMSGQRKRCVAGAFRYGFPSCGTIQIAQRSYSYCCQKWTCWCVGDPPGWVEAAALPYFIWSCTTDGPNQGRCKSPDGTYADPPTRGGGLE